MKRLFVLVLAAISNLVSGSDSINLPDPLVTGKGESVSSAQVWETQRRPEILELFREQVYGRVPATVEQQVRFEVLESSENALDGVAIRKQVRAHLSDEASGPHMDILVYLPTEQDRPARMFLGLNFMGNHAVHPDAEILMKDNFTPWGQRGRGSSRRRWPIEEILGRGYGVATIHCGDLDPDKHDGFKDGVHGAFDPPSFQTERPGDAWGAIAAWAWGLRRAMDYFESDPDIDHTKVAVLGHSRLGKTALWAGALDERFSIVISNNSGCTGAALSRHKRGESVARINEKFPHWFCGNYKQYGHNEDALPIDQHMLISLIAPRPVYVASADQDSWADPKGEFLSCVNAEPVFKLYGLEGLGTAEMPKVNETINGGHIAYHLREGKHGMTPFDWKCYMDYADRHWGREAGHD